MRLSVVYGVSIAVHLGVAGAVWSLKKPVVKERVGVTIREVKKAAAKPPPPEPPPPVKKAAAPRKLATAAPRPAPAPSRAAAPAMALAFDAAKVLLPGWAADLHQFSLPAPRRLVAQVGVQALGRTLRWGLVNSAEARARRRAAELEPEAAGAGPGPSRPPWTNAAEPSQLEKE